MVTDRTFEAKNNVLSVAAIDNQGILADFSNYGPTTVDVAGLASSFAEEMKALRQQRTMAKVVAKPDSVKVPER